MEITEENSEKIGKRRAGGGGRRRKKEGGQEEEEEEDVSLGVIKKQQHIRKHRRWKPLMNIIYYMKIKGEDIQWKG